MRAASGLAPRPGLGEVGGAAGQRTASPGRNFSVAGFGVVSVWMNIADSLPVEDLPWGLVGIGGFKGASQAEKAAADTAPQPANGTGRAWGEMGSGPCSSRSREMSPGTMVMGQGQHAPASRKAG